MEDHKQQPKLNTIPAQAYWDRHAVTYAQKPIADLPAYEEKLHRVRSVLRATDRVLEIGCGTGGTARKLKPDIVI